MLRINDLHAQTVDQGPILSGINLEIEMGSTHAIMGPNGSGKSTLAKVIAGHPGYEVTQGSVELEVDGRWIDLLELEPDERAKKGLFLGMQYPIEIPGITNWIFLKEAFDGLCEAQGSPSLNDQEFEQLVEQKADLLKMDSKFLKRAVNEGFSGGEKKKNEILQLLLLNPRMALLDETDSGLDIDALKIVAEGVNAFRSKYNALILVTHYQRLLNHIKPDFVHILSEGKIVKTGTDELAKELEAGGYEGVLV